MLFGLPCVVTCMAGKLPRLRPHAYGMPIDEADKFMVSSYFNPIAPTLTLAL